MRTALAPTTVTFANRQKSARHTRASRIVMASFYDLKAPDVNGKEVDFATFKGKVVLVTNVASKCGYTKANYQEMATLYEKYGAKGLEIVCFPCDQFGGQELPQGEICSFVEDKFKFKGRMMGKVNVNGPKTSPVWKYLKEQSKDTSDVRWNFACKFIIDKNGNVVERNGDGAAAQEPKIAKLL